MAATAARIEADMDPVRAASQMDTDEVIRLGELRSWLTALAEMSYQSTGHRRIKKPRIWSLHDLEVLTRMTPTAPPQPAPAAQVAMDEAPPEPGLVALKAPMEGSLESAGTGRGALCMRRNGHRKGSNRGADRGHEDL